jgi:dephospho-CoA kinase
MLLVGLTGGIGSGKSTVAGLLADRGAVVLDADAFARDAVRPGTEALRAVVRRFGDDVVRDDGQLDRQMLADALQAELDTDHVVVLVNPLLIEMGAHRDCDVVVVVSTEPDTQVARSVARGMREADVRARIASQLSLAERAGHADVLLDNEGSLQELEAEVDVLWRQLEDRAAAR